MATAPADIQAIMKKVMSGGIPTQDEAKRLSDYMSANRGAIARGGAAYGDSMKQKAAAVKATLLASDQPACPARVSLSSSVGLQPTSKVAIALLDSIRQAYASRLKPQALSILQSALGKVSDPAALNQLGVALLLKGYPDLAILTHAAGVQRSAGTQDAWADLGAGLLVVGDALPAIPILRYALSLGSRNPTYVADLGVAYANLGDLTTATTFLQEAIRLDPAMGQAYDALGRVASCQGNMVLAASSMKKAQDDDWDRDRQKSIEKHDAQTSQNADDDATDAAKDFPEPPGQSPFPPPPGGGRPSNFLAYSPKLPSSVEEGHSWLPYNMAMISSYQDLIRQLLSTTQKPKTSSSVSSRATPGTLVLRYSISNGDQAIAGVAVVKRRTAAKVNVMHRAWNDKYQSMLKDMAAREAPVEAEYLKCDKLKNPNCFKIYCQKMKPIVTESYSAMVGNANVFIGGLAGLSQKVSKTMNHWFFWAGDPESRRVIDIQRRYYLADFQVEAFTAATATTSLALPDGCEQELAKRPAERGTLDDAQDPGECTSRSIKLPFFATMQADCHEMTMTIDFPPITELVGGSPTLDIRRSSGDKYGKFFIGVSNDIARGAATYSAGMQVTWDQGGWVKGAGPTLTASAEDLNGIVHVGGELMANGLSKGPTMQGSVGGSIPSLGVAPSVSFGGKY
jgi:Flp pilus assembly protein TadD